jgi:hypothetical protein
MYVLESQTAIGPLLVPSLHVRISYLPSRHKVGNGTALEFAVAATTFMPLLTPSSKEDKKPVMKQEVQGG